jgi:hypothetical protein
MPTGRIQIVRPLRRGIVDGGSGEVTPSRDGGAREPSPDEDASVGRRAGLRRGISRRVFLGRGSVIAGVAAAVATVPGLSSVFTAGEVEGPELSSAAPEGDAVATEMTEPIVAHVVNAATGEINLYQGTQVVAAHSPALAQALARLAAQK